MLAPWRMAKYLVKIIEDKRKALKSKTLPLVIPIVIYNGTKPYPYSTSIYDLFAEGDQLLARQYLFNHFQLVDFSQIPDETIRSHYWTQVMELLLKHAHARDGIAVLENLKDIFRALTQETDADNYILGMLKYALKQMKIHDKTRFNQFLHDSLPSTMEQEAMTLAELYFQEGRQEGWQQGRREGHKQSMKEVAKKLLKVTADINYIREITGLSDSEIKLLEEMHAAT